MAKSGRVKLVDNILWTLEVYLLPLCRIGQRSNRIRFGEKTKQNKALAIRRSRSFKVIEVGINRKPMRLPISD